jgi:hypothetical protein
MTDASVDGKPEGADECIIPPRLPPSVLSTLVLGRDPLQERQIREYVEAEAREEVIHAEKVTTQHLRGRTLDAWDVHTGSERFWVITSPTNLYPHSLFQSLDFTITVHVGLVERMHARQEQAGGGEGARRLAPAWRQWQQAGDALDWADEAEDFQAVGMRCRQCLLELVRAVADDGMVPEGAPRPKLDSFTQWSELIANTIARGKSAERVRGYLKTIAREAWQLVQWLTHAGDAVRLDAMIAIDATQHILVVYGAALARFETGTPDRCPHCSSYRVTQDYHPEFDLDPPYVTVCEVCGWNDAGATVSADRAERRG